MPQRTQASPLMLALALTACLNPAAPEDEQDPALWADLAKPCPTDAPAYSLPSAARDSLPSDDSGVRTMDAIWAGFAREVPGGWGGLFREDGSLTMYLTDPSKQDQAINALTPLFRESGWADLADELPSAEVKQARWDFAQLYDWRRYLDQHVWRLDGVTTSGIAESRNRIEYGVQDESVRRRVSEVLAELNVPCFLVAVAIRRPAVVF